MFTHTISRFYRDRSLIPINLTEIPSGNHELNIDDIISSPATDTPIHWSCQRDSLQSIVLWSDQPLTICTNDLSTGTPQETISLVAGQDVIWTLATDGIDKCPFAGDVTSLYVTNPSSLVHAQLKIRALSQYSASPSSPPTVGSGQFAFYLVPTAGAPVLHVVYRDSVGALTDSEVVLA